jgi:hypothetical protein
VPRLDGRRTGPAAEARELKGEFGDALTVVCRPRRGTLWFWFPSRLLVWHFHGGHSTARRSCAAPSTPS